MYKDVGKEIKRTAEMIVLIMIGLLATIGFLLGYLLTGSGAFICAIVGAFLGIFIGRFMAMHLYAWGELIDSVTEIKKMLKEKEDQE